MPDQILTGRPKGPLLCYGSTLPPRGLLLNYTLLGSNQELRIYLKAQ